MDDETPQIIRRPEVQRLTGLKRAAIYEAMSEGRFPRQVQLSPRAVGWLKDEIIQWIKSRPRVG